MEERLSYVRMSFSSGRWYPDFETKGAGREEKTTKRAQSLGLTARLAACQGDASDRSVTRSTDGPTGGSEPWPLRSIGARKQARRHPPWLGGERR